MIDCGDFSIIKLQLTDAKSLSSMLLKNKERFQRFFPKTLAQNLNLEMTKVYILNKKLLVDSEEEYTLGIQDNNSGEIAGLVIVKNINRKIDDAEVAYCLGMNFGNRGWMTRAVLEICNYAKSACNLKSLFILAHKTNRASVRVAEKTGFYWKKTQLKSYKPVNEDEALDMEKFVKKL